MTSSNDVPARYLGLVSHHSTGGPASPHFLWAELLWLPRWGVWWMPSAPETTNLQRVANLLEKVRTLCGDRPISIHCAIRPALYNVLVGGATRSAHIEGLAVDFSIAGLHCDDVRAVLHPHLETLGCRMEDAPGSDWIHLDLRPVPPGGSRFFKP